MLRSVADLPKDLKYPEIFTPMMIMQLKAAEEDRRAFFDTADKCMQVGYDVIIKYVNQPQQATKAKDLNITSKL